MTNPLLDPPPIAPFRLERLERAVASLLKTRLDIVLPQAEAVLPLEAAARGLGRKGIAALNLDTSPYGATIGRWLRQTGATVIGLEAAPHEPVAPEAVEKALQANPEISMVSFVHVEAASAVRNDARAITALARDHGALVLIDVVASTGAHEVCLDDWGVDVAVIGPQKALAGPAGISIAAVSARAWEAMSDNPGAPRGSALSLLDWKQNWLDSDKSVIPGTPSPLEILALEAAVERVVAEGLESVQRRHRASAAASRSGARALGLTPYASDADAAVVATTLAAPPGTDARARWCCAHAAIDRSPCRRASASSPVRSSGSTTPASARVLRSCSTRSRHSEPRLQARPSSTARSRPRSRQQSKPGRPRKPDPLFEAGDHDHTGGRAPGCREAHTSAALRVDETGVVGTAGVLFERPPVTGGTLCYVEDLGPPAMRREPLARLIGPSRTPERHVVAVRARTVGVGLTPCPHATGTGQGESHPASRHRQLGCVARRGCR